MAKEKDYVKRKIRICPSHSGKPPCSRGRQNPRGQAHLLAERLETLGEEGRGWGGERGPHHSRGHHSSVLFSQSRGAGPGSGPAMKPPSGIFFALRPGFFHFFISCQGYRLFEDSASILQREVPVFLLGVPRGPHADMAMVISGPPWPGV